MEYYDEKILLKFVKRTKYNANSLKKVFNAYWDMGAMERHKSMNTNDTKFLKKFGIKEEVQSINEQRLWSGLKTRSAGSKGFKGDTLMKVGSGTSSGNSLVHFTQRGF